MLGVSSSLSTEEGYAQGERWRERFHLPKGTYNDSTNPIGFGGKEQDYIGDFASSSDGDNFTTVNSSTSVSGGALRVIAGASNGYVHIAVQTVPGINYTFAVDANEIQGGTYAIMQVGTGAGDGTYYNSGNQNSAATYGGSFLSTQRIAVISLYSKTNGKYVAYDNISFKEKDA